MTLAADRTQLLLELLSERILVLDGGTGTVMQGKNLTAADFGGAEFEGCNENLVRTRPDVVRWLHETYFDAGADIVETNSFGGTPLVLAEYGLADDAFELNRLAAAIAREAAAAKSTPRRPRFVAGSLGPTTKAISVTGGVTFAELVESFRVQAAGLLAGGADLLLLETTQDTRNLKAGLIGVRRAMDESGIDVPVMVSVTVEPTGTMLAGQGVEALYASVMHAPLLSVGLNCATGPEFMTDHVRSLSAIAKTRVSCYPNAGLPDENGRYGETPEMLARALARFAEAGWLNIVGGCCGTGPAHIRAIAEAMEGKAPRRVPDHSRLFLSGIDFLEATDDVRPVLVGERTNVLGSRKFKKLVADGAFEAAAEVARGQVKAGAQVIDVCLQDPDRDEMADTVAFLEKAIRMVKAPLMIDSTDAAVVAKALEYCQGKAIINSVNLEDGEERFRKIVPLAKSFGAALVVGTIDEDPQQGMAVTRRRKLEVARREFELLTEKYDVAPEDILFDPLVFPCGTGDATYVGSALETIEGIRLIKAEFPLSKTILGISNVSFGLPEAGREVLNSVFLYHATKAGLDFAIVNSEKLVRYPSIPEEERRLSEDLLFARGEDPVAAFSAHFKSKSPSSRTPSVRPGTPIERLPRYIVEGTKEGLVADLEAVRAGGVPPLEIINGPLMAGMAEVGRLFNANELIVAEVLQSAEAMKAAVDHLQSFMEKASESGKGKILLATVKGDVHDIGKNLVDIILTNNGFSVVNLGIKVPPETLIAACAEHRPDLVGLSGLLVKSAQQMVTTAGDLAAAGVDVPILVGGAALTARFTDLRISPAYGGGLVVYAPDAMAGLDLAQQLVDPSKRAELATSLAERRRQLSVAEAPAAPEAFDAPEVRSAAVEDVPPLPPPVAGEQRTGPLDVAEIARWINPQMLYGKHLGLRGSYRKRKEAGDPQVAELEAVVERVLAEGWISVQGIWRFVEAASEGNRLHLSDGGARIGSWTFPRQRSGDHLCLADFVAPAGGAAPDSIGLFVTTAGAGVRERAERLKRDGEYLLCHALQAVAVECAEAAAEFVHAQLRARWGFPDAAETTMMDRFQARYRGKRFSFGYPACPDLSGQTLLFDLLRPERIGVELTDGFMMDPEASVSAVVVHHPGAHYFGA